MEVFAFVSILDILYRLIMGNKLESTEDQTFDCRILHVNPTSKMTLSRLFAIAAYLGFLFPFDKRRVEK